MAKRTKTTTTPVEVTVDAILTNKISELETQECLCKSTLPEDEGNIVQEKCDRCKEIERLQNHCRCNKCTECVRVLLEHQKELTCTCVYEAVIEQQPSINDNGEEVMVDVEVRKLVTQCERCKEIDKLNKVLSDYNLFKKAYIDEVDYDKYEVVNGVIRNKVVETGKPSEIEVLGNKVSRLDVLDATLILNSAEQQVKINECELTNANLLLEVAMLKGGM